MNSLLPAGVSISAPTIDTSDSSKIVVFADVIANNAKDIVSVVAEVPTTTTNNNTNTSAAVSNAAKNSAAASSVKTVSSAANPITASSSAVIKATGDNTAVVFAVAALAVAGVLRHGRPQGACTVIQLHKSGFDRQRAEPLALPVFVVYTELVNLFLF